MAKPSQAVVDTSLLHYLALVPAADANWKTFSLLLALGGALTALGVYAFGQRDLEAE